MSSGLWEFGEVCLVVAAELSADEPFEAADIFFLGFAVGEATFEVGVRSEAVAELDDDDDVEGAVGCAVAGEVEAVTVGA